MKTVRIASGQGFWGDWLEAPLHQIRRGPIDYLMLDYLAEVTMSILAKQKLRDPAAGYARDFVSLIDQAAPDLAARGIKVLANAGGVNPHGCARAVIEVLKRHGLEQQLRVAVVDGDDLMPRIDELLEHAGGLRHFETGLPLGDLRAQLLSANAYLGADGLLQALKAGANIVISGRVADASLALAPMLFEFGWDERDWNRRAAGIIAGHIIECGAQASGGNCSADWESIPRLEDIGFPIVEVSEDGSFIVTKHEGTGGRVDLRSVKEQLVYEIGDPTRYTTPDVVADFTSITLSQAGPDRVAVRGARGSAPPETLKVSMSYRAGFISSGTLVFTWPDAYKKAKEAGRIVRTRLERLALPLDRVHTEIIGVNACHGPLTDRDMPEIAEVMLRIAVHSRDRDAVARFTREMAPLVLSGPPSVTGYAGGKRDVQEVAAYWPSSISRAAVPARAALLDPDET